MRSKEFVIEKVTKAQPVPVPVQQAGTGEDPLYGLKLAIANKIKDLPPDEKTQKALQEIEDLLAHVEAGGRKGHIGSELDSIEDRDVHKARSLLAKYVLSLDMTPQQRAELFGLWKNDQLVNIDKLLSIGKHTIPEIINGYDNAKNPAIKEFNPPPKLLEFNISIADLNSRIDCGVPSNALFKATILSAAVLTPFS